MRKCVGRKRINSEQIPGRFPDGTFARIDAVLEEKEKRADFLRSAVEHELAKREAEATAKPTRKARPK